MQAVSSAIVYASISPSKIFWTILLWIVTHIIRHFFGSPVPALEPPTPYDEITPIGPQSLEEESYEGNFDKIKLSDELRYTAFNCDSIMQYGEYAFTRAPKVLKTMVGKQADCKLKEPYEKAGLTTRDMDLVNKMYQCK